ncbi:hypothetical protein BASA81_015616 [Batrachochytrium salamandrivorans]|nr:hypothetical protein BASA81_015616 [Batrachochytrium salamandrivorans]
MEYRQEIRAKLFPVVVFGGPIPDFGLAKSSLASSSGLRKLAKSDFSQVSSPVNHQEPASPLPPPLPLSLGEAETGGWLRKGKAGGNKFGETVYFVINDTLGYFCPIRNGELIVEDLAQFHKIVFCEMCCSQDQYYFRLNCGRAAGEAEGGGFFPRQHSGSGFGRELDLCAPAAQ